MDDHYRAGRLASGGVEHMQVGHGNFRAFSVARAKAECVFQAALDDLVGHANVHHMGQVVFGSGLGSGQANSRGKCAHHRRHARFVHFLNFSRARLWRRLRIAQQRFNFGAAHGFDASFVNVFNGHEYAFTALLARIGQRTSHRVEHTNFDGLGLRATHQWECKSRGRCCGLGHEDTAVG